MEDFPIICKGLVPEKGKIRILTSSDHPMLHTGFANVHRHILEALSELENVQIAALGWYPPRDSNTETRKGKDDGILADNTTPWYVVNCDNQDWCGQATTPRVMKAFKPEIVLTIGDPWMVASVAAMREKFDFKWIAYVPVDGVSKFVSDHANVLKFADHMVAYSTWGAAVLKATLPNKKLSIINHGTDPEKWTNYENISKEEVKKSLFDKDYNNFIVGWIARNTQRKRADIALNAFAMFLASTKTTKDGKIFFKGFDQEYDKIDKDQVAFFCEEKKDARMYMHFPESEPRGFAIRDIADDYGISDQIFYSDNLQIGKGVSEEKLRKLYNAIDVSLNTAASEGWCVLPEAIIKTADGVKAIKDVKPGDFVYTHTGSKRKVKEVLTRDYDGEMISFKSYGRGNQILTTTPNHNIYITDKESNSFCWKQAKDVNIGDYFVYPKIDFEEKPKEYILLNDVKYIKDNFILEDGCVYANGKNQIKSYRSWKLLGYDKIKIDNDLMTLFGYYVAEGCCKVKGAIRFSFNSDETEFMDHVACLMSKCFDLTDVKPDIYTDKKCITINFNSRPIASLLISLFGHKARNKHLPTWFFGLNEELLDSFLFGYLNGDGSCGNNIISSSTGSVQLANDIFDIYNKKGICSYITSRIIDGKLYYANIVSYTNDRKKMEEDIGFGNSSSQKSIDSVVNYYINEGKCSLKVKEINKIHYRGVVYNLSVEEDESYICENIVVHNCMPLHESMCAGTPVVAPKFGGYLNDLLAHLKTGFLADIICLDREVTSNCVRCIVDPKSVAMYLDLIYYNRLGKLEEFFIKYPMPEDSDLFKAYKEDSNFVNTISQNGKKRAFELDWKNLGDSWRKIVLGESITLQKSKLEEKLKTKAGSALAIADVINPYDLKSYGPEKSFFEIIKKLSAKNHVVAVGYSTSKKPNIEYRFADVNEKIMAVDAIFGFNGAKDIAEAMNPKMIVSHGFTFIEASKLAKEKNIPLILFMYNYEFICGNHLRNGTCSSNCLSCGDFVNEDQQNIYKLFTDAMEQASIIVVPSNAFKRDICQICSSVKDINNKCMVCYPFMDLSDPNYIATNIKDVKAQDRANILAFGGMEIKGSLRVLNMAKELPEYNFLIVEAGDKITNNFRGKFKNVTFINKTNRPVNLYSIADVVIIPSITREGFSRIAIEAIANGIPVLASNQKAFKEILDPCFIIENSDDILSWSDKIRRTVTNKSSFAQLAPSMKSVLSRYRNSIVHQYDALQRKIEDLYV